MRVYLLKCFSKNKKTIKKNLLRAAALANKFATFRKGKEGRKQIRHLQRKKREGREGGRKGAGERGRTAGRRRDTEAGEDRSDSSACT